MVDFIKASTTFSDIYSKNYWGCGSGIGSTPDNVANYMRFLVEFIRNNDISSVVDVGCGDWQFSKLIDWTNINYHGFDVADKVIDNNIKSYSSYNVKFTTIRDVSDLPEADLVICKDVLQHLPLEDISDYLDIFISRYKYALITNDIYPDQWTNVPTEHGGCRAIRLDLPPFTLNSPAVLRWDVRHGEQLWIKETRLVMRGENVAADKGRIVVLQKDLKAAALEHACLQQELLGREGHIATLEQDLKAAMTEHASLQQALLGREGHVAVLEQELEAGAQEHARLEQALAALRGSTSWRATAPLRWIAGRLPVKLRNSVRPSGN